MAERVRKTAVDWSLWQDAAAARDPVTPADVKAADRQLARVRTALGGRPDRSLDTLSWQWTYEASRTQRLVFLVRCLDRVWPFVASHPELGRFARTALPAGVECCLGRPPADDALALRVWTELATALDRLVPAGDPVESSLSATGAGHAALVTAALLRTLAEPYHPDVTLLCPVAAAEASATFAAVAPEPFRSRDAARVTRAVALDLDALYHRDELDELDDPTDPGEAGPYGRLWEREPFPLEVVALRAEAVALVRALTSPGGSSTVNLMPTVDGPTITQPESPAAELAGLTPPNAPLTSSTALPELAAFPDRVRGANALLVSRFRDILSALAGHEFADRQTAAQTVRALQDVRALLGLGFVLRSDDKEKDGVRVSVVFDDNPNMATGRIRAVTTTKPQKWIYGRAAFPSLDVTQNTPDDSADD